MRKDIEYPLQSLKNTLALSARDWEQEQRDAWTWGIIFGWSDEWFEDFNRRFGWTDATWQRLKRLNDKFGKLAFLEDELFALECDEYLT